MRRFGGAHPPQNFIGQRQSITPLMLEVLCDHLVEKPGLYLDEMAIFLWDEFETSDSSNIFQYQDGRPSRLKASKKRPHNGELSNRTPICENCICTISQTLSRTTLSMLTNLDVINGLDSDEQAGLHSG